MSLVPYLNYNAVVTKIMIFKISYYLYEVLITY